MQQEPKPEMAQNIRHEMQIVDASECFVSL